MGHAKFSPSAAHRWMKCPGSLVLCAEVDDTDSEFARLGTFAHEIAEACLVNNSQASEYIGNGDCDDDMAEHVQTYVDIVRGLSQGGKMLIEQQVGIPNMQVWGTVDAAVWVGDVLHVIDFKYGSGVRVEVKDNAQLKIYALALLLAMASVRQCPSKVVMHIVQPRHPQGGHTQFPMEAEKLLEFEADVVEAVEECEKAASAGRINDYLVAGDQCRWCPVKATCPALRAHALDKAQDAFAEPEVGGPPDPAEFTDRALAEVLEAIPIIEVWIKAVREHAYERVSKGGRVPRHKLVRKGTHRRWKDDAEESLRFMLGDDIYAERKLLSPNQVSKKLGKQMQHVVDELTTKPVGDTVLAHESDPREAVASADVFQLENEDVEGTA